MNKLILKKKISSINVKKRCNKIITQKGLYYSIKKKLVSLVYLSKCLLKKYSIVTKSLNYSYTFKWKCTSLFILNSKLNSLIEFFHNIKNLCSTKNLNYLSSSKNYVSVIRSPFVYKKSMEQFFYEKYKIYHQTNVSAYNFFFHNYQYIHLKKILRKKIISKLFCKITFTFD
jgi:hypothetical protein